MNKQEFLAQLKESLASLPANDGEERLCFYSEMIDDRMEDGLSEGEAILSIGSVPEIAAQILADAPFGIPKKEKKKLKAWEIVLLVLGSPMWLSLLIAGFAVLLALYAVMWSVIISLWAAFASVAACAFGGIAGGIWIAISVNGSTGVAMVGAGMVCAGLAIFLFFGCKAATKGVLLLTKQLALRLNKCFNKKEAAL